ncbi:MAG: hypothetical protein A2315_04675 [Ignavibacteria bacterium RIFOXYB2_FULL_35_12]|nr:MAG: hypothetical protein A2058_06805 [Ignavibacteria bacterium GWA2_36_19]OGU55283.1 MAG: hypothetical protein A2006_10965 [Ignavibacteria bacterium GWC2_35_8]OGU57685.1 MAG: hypothetical protein A2X60_09815 [Ignavibacteria bacterium GWF2_35_20]OGU80308.1 MAG: hypothetical protein A2254_16875 [Ignavibacteria bacterium RIFOXYA2_FULL_35_9]OGU89616.1 MAG: hypothetical protein A3K31_15625 [Ignavibacteria bacterium RIFOXYA12_FULL_35_25]OGU94688.1 MAG: hypothetical protein A2347_03535 [Ignavibac
MSKRSDKLLLEDILEAIESILEYTNDITVEEFFTNKKTKDAVVRNFEIIGEAANKLSRELKENNRQVDWQGIIGFRNVIVHDYFGVDYEVVWNIKNNHLPKLKEEIGRLINKY